MNNNTVITAHVNTSMGIKILDNFRDPDNFVNSPIDSDIIRRSQFTGGVWEAGTEDVVFCVCDHDNPECVVEIINTGVPGTKTENTISIVDVRGYVGYIVDGYFVRNKQVSFGHV